MLRITVRKHNTQQVLFLDHLLCRVIFELRGKEVYSILHCVLMNSCDIANT